MRAGRVVAVVFAGSLGLLPMVAHADLTGTVTTTNPAGTPVAGAFVAATGTAGRYGVTTDADGHYVIAGIAAGTYDVVAQARGHQVAKASGVVVATDPVAQDLTLTNNGGVFEAVAVYGGQISGIVADAQSGVFYATTSVIPQLYRTADHGGTWTPVTLRFDDADDGLDGSNVAGGLTTSGTSGELAVQVQGTVYYSTDFGVTWKSVGSGGGGGPQGSLFWGHVGSTNVLILVSQSQTLRADMSDASPTFAAQSANYVTDAADRVTVASGTDGAWVAVARVSGTVDIYDLAENPPATVVSSLGSLPTPPTFIRLGGVKGSGVPPDALLVYANGAGDQAVMATKSGGTTWSSVSATSAVGGGCGVGPGAVGAVAPQSTGTDGVATLGQCLATKSGTGALTFASIPGINNNTGVAFDAAYDRSTNFVILAGDGNRGLVKSAQEQGGLPAFPGNVDASPGTDASAGGVAVNGIDVPVVKDTSFGPSSAAQFATALSGSGGGLSVASDDGGATVKVVVPKGGLAVDWWQGAGGTWLVFGHGGAGDLVSAYGDWNGSAPALVGPNVSGSQASTLGPSGVPEQFAITAVRGVPGADTVFIGGGRNVDQAGDAGSVYRADLSGTGTAVSFTGGSLIAGTGVSGSLVSSAVRALAYCPTDGSDASLGDVLFVAIGNDSGGAVIRIEDATGAPVESSVLSGSKMNDVRANCAAGEVWVGAGSNGGGPSGALYKSTDGGVTFAPVGISGAGLPPSLNVQTLAVSPDDPDYVLIAGNSEGFILQTTDGGTTWSAVNDPHTTAGRNFLSEGIGDLEIPSSVTSGSLGASVTGQSALVGTGGGLFAADFAGGPTPEICTSAAECDDADACTTDTCPSGLCRHTEEATAASVQCELDQAKDLRSCADPKTRKLIGKKLNKAGALVRKIGATTKAAKIAKLRRAVDNLLTKLSSKVGRSKRSAGDCKLQVQDQLDDIRALLDDLGS